MKALPRRARNKVLEHFRAENGEKRIASPQRQHTLTS